MKRIQKPRRQTGDEVISLAEFLERNVEGYLFEDLRAMTRTAAPMGVGGGGVGYPLLVTTFAAIELLGVLTSTTRFNPRKGHLYFSSFWSEFLYPGQRHAAELAAGLYKLARHGLAHAFVVKANIGVVKGEPARHLKMSNGIVWIDASSLAEDLVCCYEDKVKPLSVGVGGAVCAATMSMRLNEMERDYSAEADDVQFGQYLDQETVAPSGPYTWSPGVILGSFGPKSDSAAGGPTGPTFPRSAK